MKLKHTLLLSSLALCGTMQAQDIYKAETLSGSDLTGTARFVGMGGAMSALGADMSAMSNNPAAIGLYRRSDVAMTASVLGQSEAWPTSTRRVPRSTRRASSTQPSSTALQ